MLKDITENKDYYRFPSDLENRVSGALPVTSPEGTSALAEQLKTKKIILVLFANRTGSNIVTDILEQVGFGLGATNEPLLADTIIRESLNWGFKSLDHYLASVISNWSFNDICFIKLGWDSVAWLSAEGLLGLLLKHSCVIWTRRRDKIAQGVSMLKAWRTNSFFCKVEDEAAEAPLITKSDENLSDLMRIVHDVYVADYRLQYFVDIHNLRPLEIYFEDMVENIQGTSNRVVLFVAQSFGLNSPINSVKYNPSFVRQSTTENIALREWYLREMESVLRVR